MLRRALPLALALGVCLAPAAALAADVLIWTPKGDGAYETRWVTVDGGRVTPVATRPEAVVSDGKNLWAVRVVTTELALHPCDDMEKAEADQGPAESTFDWPSLQAELLGPGDEHWIIGLPTGKRMFGEIWNEKITLTGSAGGVVMVDHNTSGYGCGAHGFVDDSRRAWSLLDRKELGPETLVVNESKVRAAPVEALMKQAKAEDCVEEDAMSRESIFLDGITLDAKAGKVTPALAYVLPTGADWQFACTIEQRHGIAVKDLEPALRPDADVTRALKALKIKGTVGYATLALAGEARAKALAAFQGQAPPPAKQRTWASAAAQPFIAQGRKLTKAKQYAEAIAAFDTAIRKDPTAARAWSGRGYAKLLAGQLDQAARDFDQALRLDATDPFHAAVWYNLGQIAEKQGKTKQARRAYRHSNKLKPSKGAAAALKRLK